MAVNWELYEEIVNGNTIGTTSGANQSTTTYEEGLLNDPGYQPNATVNGVNQPIVVKRSSSIKAGTISFSGASLHIGDIVHVYDADWIVTECYEDSVGLIQSVIWLCNATIRFQNRTNEVLEKPCVIDDGSYSKKTGDPMAYIPENTYKAYLSMDKDTVKLYVDKRLAFGVIFNSKGEQVLEVYKISGIDFISKNFGEGSHLMQMLVQRDVYNVETDSVELNLCDVYKEKDNNEKEEGVGSCYITGLDCIRVGTKRTYTATFKDCDGNIVDGVRAIWTVEAPDSIAHNIKNNTCTITVPLSEELIGRYISISLTNENKDYGSFQKTVEVTTIG